MNQNLAEINLLPAPLESAVARLKLAMRAATERTIESLGLSALGAHRAIQREELLAAQQDLNRHVAAFHTAFDRAFDTRLQRELGGVATAVAAGPQASGWQALTLVEDRVVDAQITADRVAMDVAALCEWELRELDGYIASLLPACSGNEAVANPLRPSMLADAMARAIEAVTERTTLRPLLSVEIGRSLGPLLRDAYIDIVAQLNRKGVQPLTYSVRQQKSSTSAARTGSSESSGAPGAVRPGGAQAPSTGDGSAHSSSERRSANRGEAATTRAAILGAAEAALTQMMRRLAQDEGQLSAPHEGGGQRSDSGLSKAAASSDPHQPLQNLIHAHRSALREASRGGVDHMVIDVIGGLFDEILADPRVPPQLARQIARLQLPVLRAALIDSSFFASRRHPARRFVNRIASLGAAFEDFENDEGREFLVHVAMLVQQVVEGDFDQLAIYEQKLSALEAMATQVAADHAAQVGVATEALAAKEQELQRRAQFARQLATDLQGLAVPGFLHDFLVQVWSHVLLQQAGQTANDPLHGRHLAMQAERFRAAPRMLVLSVQGKPTPSHRRQFLIELPVLMQTLTEGVGLIRWPDASSQEFFGRLMPAHAKALRAPAGRELDLNLMARRVETAFARPLPGAEGVATAPEPGQPNDDERAKLSVAEAREMGIADEATMQWDGTVDIDVQRLEEEKAVAQAAAAPIGLLPAPVGPAELTQGRPLADHVQAGLAYDLHLEGTWRKARLSFISPGRAFFVFTHGERYRQTLSLTYRMLVRLCEAQRLRNYESAYLLERATARAQPKLARIANQAGA
jgi:hypothetical protein